MSRGAGRLRVLQQSLVESLALALVGSASGLPIARFAVALSEDATEGTLPAVMLQAALKLQLPLHQSLGVFEALDLLGAVRLDDDELEEIAALFNGT